MCVCAPYVHLCLAHAFRTSDLEAFLASHTIGLGRLSSVCCTNPRVGSETLCVLAYLSFLAIIKAFLQCQTNIMHPALHVAKRVTIKSLKPVKILLHNPSWPKTCQGLKKTLVNHRQLNTTSKHQQLVELAQSVDNLGVIKLVEDQFLLSESFVYHYFSGLTRIFASHTEMAVAKFKGCTIDLEDGMYNKMLV